MEDLLIGVVDIMGYIFSTCGLVGLIAILALILVIAFFVGRKQASSELVKAERTAQPKKTSVDWP